MQVALEHVLHSNSDIWGARQTHVVPQLGNSGPGTYISCLARATLRLGENVCLDTASSL